MVESRWFRRAGPAVAALGGIALIATTTLGAPGPAWTPEACAGAPRIGAPAPGTWYRTDPVLDAGTRTGQRVVLGRAGERGTRALDLDAESFAAGPFGGATLVGTDDGRRSRLSLIDAAHGCAWPLGDSRDVVRTATLAPDGRSLFEFRVDRRTRADLGVWRRTLDGSAAPSRVLAPIADDARFGPTWITDFIWSEDERWLAVQSCGEISCRVRILDPRGGGAVRLVADPSLGDVVGLDGSHLVAHGACRGLPCPLLSVDIATSATLILDPLAGQAVLSRDADGRTVAVHEVGAGGDHLRMVGLDGRGPQLLEGDPQRRLVAGPARSGSAAELIPGWLLFGPDGRLPIDGSLRPILRHVPDGRAVQLDEVSR